MTRLSVAVVRVVLVAVIHATTVACSPESATTPTSPSTSRATGVVTRPVTNTSNSITGSVTDTASRPLDGARVEITDGSEAGTFTITNSNGRFSFASGEEITDSTHFRATKEGYIPATTSIGELCGGSCGAFRSLQFALGSLAQPIDIAGDYTVSFIAEGECASIPEEVRTRTYVATIRRSDTVSRPPGTFFNVTFMDLLCMFDIGKARP